MKSCPRCSMPFQFCGPLVRCPVCKADLFVGIASSIIGAAFAALVIGGYA